MQIENLTAREAVTLGAGACGPTMVCLKRTVRGCWNQNFNQMEHSDFVQNSNM